MVYGFSAKVPDSDVPVKGSPNSHLGKFRPELFYELVEQLFQIAPMVVISVFIPFQSAHCLGHNSGSLDSAEGLGIEQRLLSKSSQHNFFQRVIDPRMVNGKSAPILQGDIISVKGK